MEYDDYFDGEESIEQDSSAEAGDRAPKTGKDTVFYLPPIGAVTFDEVHSVTLGFAVAFLLTVSGLLLWWETIGTLVAYVGVRGVTRRLSDTVDKHVGYAVRELHWFLGGGVFGILTGVPIYVLLRALGPL